MTMQTSNSKGSNNIDSKNGVGKKYITPDEYLVLPFNDRFNYFAEHKKYKTIKEREYCDECGHFRGWISREVPVGKPYRFRKATNPMEITAAMMNEATYKQITHSNVIAARVLNT